MVAPSKGTISALGERDVAPDGRQCFSLLLEYSFKQTDAGEVTPRLSALNGYLYDSAFEAQMYMIFDSNKKVLLVKYLLFCVLCVLYLVVCYVRAVCVVSAVCAVLLFTTYTYLLPVNYLLPVRQASN